MGRQKISYDSVALAEAVSSGKSYAELTDYFRVSMGTLKKWLIENNLEVSEKWRKGPRLTDRDIKCRVLREEGKTLQEIGDSLGITREAVRQSLNKQGVEPRRHLSEKVKIARVARLSALRDISEKYLQDIEAMLKSGSSVSEVKKCFNLTSQQVKDLGLGSLKASYDESRLKEIVDLYESGLSMSKVSEVTGYHIQSILRILKRRGVPRRARHRWNQVS
jgi:predicted HTH domain antitoxin